MSEINGDNHAEKNTGGLNSVGAAVTEKTLNVIYFNMNDSGWADDVMQSCNEKIGDSGCALTAFAMIVNYLTGEGNPGTVNTKLGVYACGFNYTEAARIYGFTILAGSVGSNDNKELSYAETAEYAVKCITDGYPLLIGMKDSSKGTHFVVATGFKKNSDNSYTISINDPGYRTRKELAGYFNGTWGNYYTNRMYAYKK